MRGIIFRTFTSFIETKFGYEKVDNLLLSDTYPNKGGFSTAGNYDVKYLHSLIKNSAYLFKNSQEQVQEAFGKFAFGFLLDRFKASYQDNASHLHSTNAYDFLENLNIIHFEELNKLYPDAKFPRFELNRLEKEHIIIEYCSAVNIPHFVFGLLQGCLKYYQDDSEVIMSKECGYKIVDENKSPVHRFEVKKNG